MVWHFLVIFTTIGMQDTTAITRCWKEASKLIDRRHTFKLLLLTPRLLPSHTHIPLPEISSSYFPCLVQYSCLLFSPQKAFTQKPIRTSIPKPEFFHSPSQTELFPLCIHSHIQNTSFYHLERINSDKHEQRRLGWVAVPKAGTVRQCLDSSLVLEV